MKNQLLPIVLLLALLFAVSSCKQQASGGVEIIRDEYGTPHIYADNTFDLFYGYGYSVAQDRLFQMEMTKRATQGMVGKVLGKDYVGFDISARKLYHKEDIQKQLATIQPKQLDVLKGYAEGMNAWIDSVATNEDKYLPLQFKSYGFSPSKWSAYDVMMVFVGTMCNRYSDFNTEIENLALLNALQEKHGKEKGAALFEQIVWKVPSDAITTIEETNEKENNNKETGSLYLPNQLDAKAVLSQIIPNAVNPTNNNYVPLAEDDKLDFYFDNYKAHGINGIPAYRSASNMMVVGKEKSDGHNAILLNGPQFGWFNPAYVYGVGLHGAGFDIVGNTPFAYPFLVFGHNQHISWGATAGFGDVIDVFSLPLHANNQYEYKGEILDFTERFDTISIKNAPDTIVSFLSAVHGTVISVDEKNKVAYAKKRSWAGKEVRSFFGWQDCTVATNYQDWSKAVYDMAISINLYYADNKGNIGYHFAGDFPIRAAGFDYRLPKPGDGSADWEGYYPSSENPAVYNPKSGYIMNWNNAPEPNYESPDLFFYRWSSIDRGRILKNMVETADKVSEAEIRDILKRSSFTDVNFYYYKGFLKTLLDEQSMSKEVAELYQKLMAWDGIQDDTNTDGIMDDEAYFILKTWLEVMTKKVYSGIIPEPYVNWYLSAAYRNQKAVNTAGSNISAGVKLLWHILNEDSESTIDWFKGKSKKAFVLEALAETTKQLQSVKTVTGNYRSEFPKTYYLHTNFLGIPQANKDELITSPLAMNRGTENNLTLFSIDGKITGFDAVAPGQSGFISIDGTKSPHYNDQLELYENFEFKKMYFNKAELLKNKESVIQLRTDN